MFQAPINNIVLELKTKWIRNFTSLMKIAAIQNNTSVEPADFVQITGKVISVPKEVSTRREYEGFSVSDIQPGDQAIFSYQVVYNFASTSPDQDPIYKNLVTYRGKEFWLCDVMNLFAVVRDDKIRMQNGYVMLRDMAKPPMIILSQATKRSITSASAIIGHIGKPLTHQRRINAEVGDKVYFNPNVLQNYQMNNKPFGIIHQSKILGAETPDYKEFSRLN